MRCATQTQKRLLDMVVVPLPTVLQRFCFATAKVIVCVGEEVAEGCSFRRRPLIHRSRRGDGERVLGSRRIATGGRKIR